MWRVIGVALAFFIFSARQTPRPDWLNFVGDAEFRQDLYVLAGLIALFGIIQLIAGLLRAGGNDKNGFMEVVGDLFRMPRTMRQLAVVQFFTWFGLFSQCGFTARPPSPPIISAQPMQRAPPIKKPAIGGLARLGAQRRRGDCSVSDDLAGDAVRLTASCMQCAWCWASSALPA